MKRLIAALGIARAVRVSNFWTISVKVQQKGAEKKT